MRSSYDSALLSIVTSPPVASHTSAIALMNEIFVARKALAATLTSCAVAKSVTTTGVDRAITGPNAARSRCSAAADRTPNTSRSGASVSSTAKPSRRNSGFHANSTSLPRAASIWAANRSAVPAGTVLLPTSRLPVRAWASRVVKAASTKVRSAAYSPSFCGVPTHRKWTSPNAPTSS